MSQRHGLAIAIIIAVVVIGSFSAALSLPAYLNGALVADEPGRNYFDTELILANATNDPANNRVAISFGLNLDTPPSDEDCLTYEADSSNIEPQACSGTSDTVDAEEDNAAVQGDAAVLDFGIGFDLSTSAGDEVEIVIDVTEAVLADDSVWLGNGSAVVTAIGDCDDSGGNHLNYDTGTNAFSCGTSSGAAASTITVDESSVEVISALATLDLGAFFDVTDGGSGRASITADFTEAGLADDSVWLGSSGALAVVTAIGDCDDSGGNHLNYDTGTNAFSCGTSSSGGGGSTVAVDEDGATIVPTLDTLDFRGGFDVTASGPNATVTMDVTDAIYVATSWGDGSAASVEWTFPTTGEDPILRLGAGLLDIDVATGIELGDGAQDVLRLIFNASETNDAFLQWDGPARTFDFNVGNVDVFTVDASGNLTAGNIDYDLTGLDDLLIPNSGTPTVDGSGSIAISTKTPDEAGGIVYERSGVDERIIAQDKGGIIITNATNSDDMPFAHTNFAGVLERWCVTLFGGTAWSGQIQIADTDGLSPADTTASDITRTTNGKSCAGPRGSDTVAISTSTLDAGDAFYIKTTASTASPDITVMVYWSYD